MEQDHLLEEGEIMLEKIHKHWIVYVSDFVLHAFGLVLCIVGFFILMKMGANMPGLGEVGQTYTSVFLGFLMLLFWVSFFYGWTKNYFDIWYVTNKHIIAIDQKDIFERNEAYMELSRIQDVLFEKSGFIQTFFGFGILKVQSAGTEADFIIKDVFEVENVAHRIMELRDSAKNK